MRKSALIVIATVATGTANAAESGWYVGASAGSSSSGVNTAQMDEVGRNALSAVGLNVQTAGNTSVDDSDVAWSILAGYQVGRYFAVEAAYVDLGSAEYRYKGEAGRIGGTLFPPRPAALLPADSTITIDSSGFSITGSGILPLGERFDLHAKLGVFIANTELSSTIQATNRNSSGDIEDDSQDLIYGAGATYRFTERWSVSLDWQRYSGLGIDREKLEESLVSFSEDDIEGDTDAITLSLLLSF
jgi:OmpA-OmpF porin, OOP family